VNAVAPQLLDTPANRATFPAGVMAHAVAPEATADVITARTRASRVIHSGSRSWEGPQSPRCQASVSTVNSTRITMIR
jgi:hypothetical protein